MEESALTVVRGLVRLIIQISIVAAVFGFVLIPVSARRLARAGAVQKHELGDDTRSSMPNSPALERIAVTVCALLAIVGVTAMVTNEIRRNPVPHPAFPALLALLVLLSAPALMWRSRLRVPAEGLATIAVSVVAVLTGFSIGVAFLPLVVLMMWVCFRHLRSG